MLYLLRIIWLDRIRNIKVLERASIGVTLPVGPAPKYFVSLKEIKTAFCAP